MEKKVFIAPNATIVGDVELGENVSIWYGAVLRGDSGKISIGLGSNVQDNCVIHEATTLGSGCSVGHGAILHGCTVGNDCVIGMGAILLNGAVIGDRCLVGAGSVVTGKMNAPDDSLILGNPATVVKPLNEAQIDYIYQDAKEYVELAKKAFE